MKTAIAILSALFLIDYAAAAVHLSRKLTSSHMVNKAAFAQGYERQKADYGLPYDELGQEQNIQSNRDYDYRLEKQDKPINRKTGYKAKEIISTAPGMTNGTMEVVYKSPNKGRVVVNLINANKDVLISIDARYNWYYWKNVLILNSMKADEGWGTPVTAEEFPFRCCGLVNFLGVEIGESAFIISPNGGEIIEYPYREDLEPPVDAITFYAGDTQATEKTELQFIAVYY